MGKKLIKLILTTIVIISILFACGDNMLETDEFMAEKIIIPNPSLFFNVKQKVVDNYTTEEDGFVYKFSTAYDMLDMLDFYVQLLTSNYHFTKEKYIINTDNMDENILADVYVVLNYDEIPHKGRIVIQYEHIIGDSNNMTITGSFSDYTFVEAENYYIGNSNQELPNPDDIFNENGKRYSDMKVQYTLNSDALESDALEMVEKYIFLLQSDYRYEILSRKYDYKTLDIADYSMTVDLAFNGDIRQGKITIIAASQDENESHIYMFLSNNSSRFKKKVNFDHSWLFTAFILNFFSYWALLYCILNISKRIFRFIILCIKKRLRCKCKNISKNFRITEYCMKVVMLTIIIIIACLYTKIASIYKTDMWDRIIILLIILLGSSTNMQIVYYKRQGRQNKHEKPEPNLDISDYVSTILVAIVTGITFGIIVSYLMDLLLIISIIVCIILSLLIIWPLMLYIIEKCRFSVNALDSVDDFSDKACMSILLANSSLLILYEYILFYQKMKTTKDLFIGFPLTATIILLIIFLYRMGTGKISVQKEYTSDNKKLTETMAWTIMLFIFIQISIFTSVIMYVTAIQGGLEWPGRDTEIYCGATNALYYVIMTYTSVGYGDFEPVSRFMKMIACGISLCGFLSSVFFISTLFGMFRNGNDKNNLPTENNERHETVSVLNNTHEEGVNQSISGAESMSTNEEIRHNTNENNMNQK